MLYYLHLLAEHVSYCRVFQYITVRAFAGAGTAFVLCLWLGPGIIRRLGRLCAAGDRYRADAPALAALHGDAKQRTPTMGGLLIITAVTVATLLWAAPGSIKIWIALATLLVMGLIGWADDYLKTVRRDPRGLRPRQKLLWQCLWTSGVGVVLLWHPETASQARLLMAPFLKAPLIAQLSLPALLVVMLLVVVGASNAVNLTDGLDGLAIGCVGAVALAYLVMCYVAGHALFANYLQVPAVPGAGELAVFCGCLLGASLGFLWFNCHPAQVIMGDTGSLALGGALGMVAVLIKQELALVIVGGVFVLEALSVMLQVGSFKLRRRRIFACAPLHHHFEVKPGGWSETQVTVRFWILAVMFALVGVLILKIR